MVRVTVEIPLPVDSLRGFNADDVTALISDNPHYTQWIKNGWLNFPFNQYDVTVVDTPKIFAIEV